MNEQAVVEKKNPSPPNFQITSNGMNLQLDGSVSIGPVVIFGSSNLVNWESFLTNPPMLGSIYFADSSATNHALRFYRAEEK